MSIGIRKGLGRRCEAVDKVCEGMDVVTESGRCAIAGWAWEREDSLLCYVLYIERLGSWTGLGRFRISKCSHIL